MFRDLWRMSSCECFKVNICGEFKKVSFAATLSQAAVSKFAGSVTEPLFVKTDPKPIIGRVDTD